MRLTAKDVMSKYGLVTISPSVTLENLDHLLVQNEISGVPVVNAEGEVLGVVSRSDLVGFIHEESGGAADFYGSESAAPKRKNRKLDEELRSRVVRDIMGTRLYSVGPDVPIGEVAGMMRRHHIHRVLVMDGPKLLGLVATFDLLGVIQDPQWRAYWEDTDFEETEVEFLAPSEGAGSEG